MSARTQPQTPAKRTAAKLGQPTSCSNTGTSLFVPLFLYRLFNSLFVDLRCSKPKSPPGQRSVDDCRRAMSIPTSAFFFLLLIPTSVSSASLGRRSTVVEVEGGPDGVVWVVQLSDLHFSVFHQERALDFKTFIGPALYMINPSLVLITGDLTGMLSELCCFLFGVSEFSVGCE